MAFSFANLEQDVGLFFVDKGVLQLLNAQSPNESGYKNHMKSYGALTFYDIDKVYVCEDSLKEYGLTPHALCIQPTLFKRVELPKLISPFKQTVNF